jgi:cation diffusion facilitator family transporter
MNNARLLRLMWVSLAAAVATITLKTTAWLLTGAVGLLSDAAESVVNLVAAAIAMAALRWAAKPADEEHAYGRAKAEYFSAGAEGALIVVAAVSIAVTATARLLHPQAIEDVGVGLIVSAAASLINLEVGRLLLRTGRERNAIALEAEGRHLMADVWRSFAWPPTPGSAWASFAPRGGRTSIGWRKSSTFAAPTRPLARARRNQARSVPFR